MRQALGLTPNALLAAADEVLYSDLAEREAKIRRLLNANIVEIVIGTSKAGSIDVMRCSLSNQTGLPMWSTASTSVNTGQAARAGADQLLSSRRTGSRSADRAANRELPSRATATKTLRSPT